MLSKHLLAFSILMISMLLPSGAVAQTPPLDTWVLQNPVRTPTGVQDLAVGADGVGWAAGDVPLRSAYAGDSWQPVVGRTTSERNRMVSVGGTSTIVMGGWYTSTRNTLEVSNDGGLTWATAALGGNYYINDGVFADAMEGWVVGSDGGQGVILHTTDGGRTWNRQPIPWYGALAAVDYESGTLCVVGNYSILVSTDRGATWSRTWIGYDIYGFSDVDMVSADIGIAVGPRGAFRTTNGGVDWVKAKRQPTYPSDLMSVVFKDAFTGWIHGSGADEWITRDGGVTWESQYTKYMYRDRYGAGLAKPGIAGGYWPRGSSVGWRYDTQGGVYFSVDGGTIWYSTAVDSFTLDDLHSVSFVTPEIGFATTSRGRIWKSTDSGGTWSACAMDPLPAWGGDGWLGSVVKTPTRGFASGALSAKSYGVIYRSTASGDSWEAVFPPLQVVNDVWSNDGQTLWAVGPNGGIARSFNAGSSWSLRGATAAAGTNFRSIRILPSGAGYAVGKGAVLRTVDGGGSWTRCPLPPTTDIRSVSVIDTDTVWVGTELARVYVSTDGGASWSGGNVGVGTDESGWPWVSSLRATSATEAVALCDGRIWSTPNGAAWAAAPLAANVELNGIASSGEGMWAYGDRGHLYYNAKGHPEYLPPSTRIGVPLGWRKLAVDMNMVGLDADGIDATLYCIDPTSTITPVVGSLSASTMSASGTSWGRYTRPRRIAKQGTTRVDYFSVDRRGNVEPKKTSYIKIDTVKPTILFTAKSRYRKNTTLTIKASDATSKVRTIMVGCSTPDKGYAKTYRGSVARFKLTRRGYWNLDVVARDNAGNERIYRKRIRVY